MLVNNISGLYVKYDVPCSDCNKCCKIKLGVAVDGDERNGVLRA